MMDGGGELQFNPPLGQLQPTAITSFVFRGKPGSSAIRAEASQCRPSRRAGRRVRGLWRKFFGFGKSRLVDARYHIVWGDDLLVVEVSGLVDRLYTILAVVRARC